VNNRKNDSQDSQNKVKNLKIKKLLTDAKEWGMVRYIWQREINL
jgi:hypothetical protein